ncbi:membrane protein containing DUF6, transmembrane [mine drainage metagenome]|uniref:Membrane protein containing DUF6, transmembrane n=1 Tax=mine drainage metagenome TaxID=410659 RepID=T0YE70_9ZZZZ
MIQSIAIGSLHPEKINGKVLQLGLLMGIFSTALPTFLMSQGIAYIGASRAAILSFFGPVATLFLAMIFLGERISGEEAFGAIMVFSGIIMISIRKEPSTSKEVEPKGKNEPVLMERTPQNES